ncbi:hypothetical protein [Collinsella aerofaciens]|uniref:hypothetical protein n=1 Tax=Collinsella aerofaciens TaxID=74426 RepID=UPI001D02B739|nr:hypothetical protein [Collinsella aerofaciens]MCB5367022.1 hypothetical protein [Collinsella aerofaciens]MCB5368978.1 hypothetical protein [Collinsella aerofaciens]
MKKLKKVGLITGGILFSGALFLASCSDTDTTQPQKEKAKEEQVTKQDKQEKATSQGKNTSTDSKETAKPATKPKENLKPVTLGAGKFKVGEDIPAGKYVVSTQAQSGNFVVYDNLGLAEVNEILGTDTGFAVNNVTVDLKKGQTIEISGINSVLFTPKEGVSANKTSQQTEKSATAPNKTNSSPVTLGAGKFKVGEDIPAGKYVVSTQAQSGNFVVYDSLGLAEVNEILGTDSSLAVNNLTVDLKKGQTIEISGINSVTFQPKK